MDGWQGEKEGKMEIQKTEWKELFRRNKKHFS